MISRNRKIVIVEDDPELVEKLESVFQLKQIEVLSVADGLKGLKLIREILPDIILLNLLSQQLDGYRLARLIKFDDRYSHIPIIAMSHVIRSKNENLTYEVGISTFLPKPLDMEHLLNMVDELLQ